MAEIAVKKAEFSPNMPYSQSKGRDMKQKLKSEWIKQKSLSKSPSNRRKRSRKANEK